MGLISILTEEEMKKLITYKYNNSKKEKKIQSQSISFIEKPQQNDAQKMAAKLSRFEKEIQQVQFIKNQGELYSFLSLCISQWGIFEFNEFLKIIHASGIKDNIFKCVIHIMDYYQDHDNKKNLLLQACLFYDGSQVNLEQNLLSAILDDFQFMNDELEQCFGFVQLLYENSESAFSSLKISKIIQIEKELPRLANLLGIFLKNQMNPTLQAIFPPTLFCLTPPIIDDLKKNKGQAFTYNIPIEWVELYTNILANSFEVDKENFYNFIHTMQNYFKKHYRKLKHYNFSLPLKYFSELLQKRDLKWIGQLKKIQQFLQFIIEDIILNKEQHLNESIIVKILDEDKSLLDSIPDNKFIKNAENFSHSFLEEIEEMNIKNERFSDFIETFKLCQYSEVIKKILKISNIDVLHPIQDLCLQYLIKAENPVFSIIGIGNGKTILCNFLAAYFSKYRKQKVIVLNKVQNLSQRNAMLFEKTYASQLELIVAFDISQHLIDYDVIFLSENEMQKLFVNKNESYHNYVLICDEADQLLFPEEPRDLSQKELEKWKDKIIFFKQFLKLFFFTGTHSFEEKEVVQAVITKDIVVFPPMNKMKKQTLTLIKETQYNQKDHWLKDLTSEIISKSKEVPILILSTEVADKQIIKSVTQASNHSVMITSLIGKTPNEIITIQDTTIQFEKDKGYPAIIVDETLGRGLDLKSSPQIEEQGGIYVILSKIPSTSKTLDQVLGRTQRRLNKGQYSSLIMNTYQKSKETIIKEGNNKVLFNIKKLIQILKNHFKSQIQLNKDDKQNNQVSLQENMNNCDVQEKDEFSEDIQDEKVLIYKEPILNKKLYEKQVENDLNKRSNKALLEESNSKIKKALIDENGQNQQKLDSRKLNQKLQQTNSQLETIIKDGQPRNTQQANIVVKRSYNNRKVNMKAKKGQFDDFNLEEKDEIHKRQKTNVKFSLTKNAKDFDQLPDTVENISSSPLIKDNEPILSEFNSLDQNKGILNEKNY